MPLPPIFFSVDSNNLKSMSFKFGNDIFITFEMPGVAYSMSFDKIHISLQFCPSVIRGPWTESTKQMEEKLNFQVPAEGLELVILLHLSLIHI